MGRGVWREWVNPKGRGGVWLGLSLSVALSLIISLSLTLFYFIFFFKVVRVATFILGQNG